MDSKSLGLVTRWLSCFNWFLHHYHLLLSRESTARPAWRNKENRNDKNHHGKVSFFSPNWVLKCFFFWFAFGKNVFLRYSHQEVFCKKKCSEKFPKIHRKKLCCEFCEILKTLFLKENLRWLLLLLFFLSNFYYVICSCWKTFKLT